MNEEQQRGRALLIVVLVSISAVIGYAVWRNATSTNSNSTSSLPSATATASPTATPIPANPSELSSLVWRFYHDLDLRNGSSNKAALNDLGAILTPQFLRQHDATWGRDYGYIRDPKLTVSGVRGYAVDYMLDYDYIGNRANLYWQRTGTWVAAHGASGWVLNEDKWASSHIVAIQLTNGVKQGVQDKVYADGRHTFDVETSVHGYTFDIEVTFSADNHGWKTTSVAVSTPTPGAPAEQYQAAPTAPYYGAPGGDCDDDSIETVGEDGAILEMLSGAVYRVQDYDTSTSSLWLAADDVLICGDRIIDKDEDGESVDAYRVR